jgi:hypothetical protein
MNQVTSKDGTSIAYDCQGSGLAVVLIGGGLDDGSENAPLVAELADGFTVFNYTRGLGAHPRVRRCLLRSPTNRPLGKGHVADPGADRR